MTCRSSSAISRCLGPTGPYRLSSDGAGDVIVPGLDAVKNIAAQTVLSIALTKLIGADPGLWVTADALGNRRAISRFTRRRQRSGVLRSTGGAAQSARHIECLAGTTRPGRRQSPARGRGVPDRATPAPTAGMAAVRLRRPRRGHGGIGVRGIARAGRRCVGRTRPLPRCGRTGRRRSGILRPCTILGAVPDGGASPAPGGSDQGGHRGSAGGGGVAHGEEQRPSGG
jgi:hypothetical protein